MLRTISLEWVGSSGDIALRDLGRFIDGVPGKFLRRPWVAEIIGYDRRFKFCRSFVRGQVDYSEANSQGSRGVYLHFHVRDGGVYEIFRFCTWRRSERGFYRIAGADWIEMTADQVKEWLFVREGLTP